MTDARKLKIQTSKVSVVVPIYNSEKYLSDCLDSIVRQSYQNIEIILIDDGSQDLSEKICKQYAENDSRVIFFQQENRGVSSARNRGISLATGEYILFVDSDDVIHKDHIKILYDGIVLEEADACFSGLASLSERDSLNITLNKELFPSYFKVNKTEALDQIIYRKISGWESVAKLYKLNLIKDIAFCENENLGEDFSYTYQVIHRLKHVVICTKPSYYYIFNPCSRTNAVYSDESKKLLDIAFKFKKFIKENYPEKSNLYKCFYLHVCMHVLDNFYSMKCVDDNNVIKNVNKAFKKYLWSVIFDSNVRLPYKIKLLLCYYSPFFYKAAKKLKENFN